MPAFTAKDVQTLRQATGAGMMDAKRALQENDGDAEAAAKWLRERGLAQSAKRADRANEQGAVAVATTATAGAIVELRCETDFVAKSEQFRALVSDLAEKVAEAGESAGDGAATQIDELKVVLKENIALGRIVRFEAAAGNVLDAYLHVQNDRGINAVLVELAGGSAELAHDVAVHIAFTRPPYLRREDVPAEVVEAERSTLESITRNEGKPEQAIPKIVEGRLNGFYKELCLLEQPWVRDEKQTIAQHLGDATIVRYAQVVVGA